MKSAFIVNLSRGEKIQIDEDEVPKLVNGIKNGSVIIFRQGIVNPSFIISIVRDMNRMRFFWEEEKSLEFNKETYPDKKFPKELSMKPLQDIFETIKDKLLEAPKGN